MIPALYLRLSFPVFLGLYNIQDSTECRNTVSTSNSYAVYRVPRCDGLSGILAMTVASGNFLPPAPQVIRGDWNEWSLALTTTTPKRAPKCVITEDRTYSIKVVHEKFPIATKLPYLEYKDLTQYEGDCVGNKLYTFPKSGCQNFTTHFGQPMAVKWETKLQDEKRRRPKRSTEDKLKCPLWELGGLIGGGIAYCDVGDFKKNLKATIKKNYLMVEDELREARNSSESELGKVKNTLKIAREKLTELSDKLSLTRTADIKFEEEFSKFATTIASNQERLHRSAMHNELDTIQLQTLVLAFATEARVQQVVGHFEVVARTSSTAHCGVTPIRKFLIGNQFAVDALVTNNIKINAADTYDMIQSLHQALTAQHSAMDAVSDAFNGTLRVDDGLIHYTSTSENGTRNVLHSLNWAVKNDSNALISAMARTTTHPPVYAFQVIMGIVQVLSAIALARPGAWLRSACLIVSVNLIGMGIWNILTGAVEVITTFIPFLGWFI